MSYGLTRSTVMAVVPETTEGTVVAPSAATQFIPVLPDFSMKPEVDLLANEELKNSIGKSKPIKGIESGSADFSLYIKHSGVEGQAPNYGELLESVFGGVSTNSTQRLTTSGSTVSTVKLASGGGDFSRGKAVLVKDSTNGYSIRPVLSVSSNDLSLAFNLSSAPASGIGVGKCINYAPANSGHQSLSLHLYRGNGTAYEIVSGAKAIEYTLEATAGDFISQSFSMVGSKYYFDPITITSSTKYLDFNDGSDRSCSVTEGVYRTPQSLADALQTAMNNAGSSDTFTVTFNNSGTNAGKFTLSSSGGTFSLKFATGANTANTIATKLGFTVADETSATSYNSDSAISWAAPYTPTYDSADPLVAKYNEVLLGDAADTVGFCAQSISLTISHDEGSVECINAETGIEAKFYQGREVKINLVGKLDQHDQEKFYRYLNNSDTAFMFAFGNKSGGNWVAGQCGCLYIPSCVVSNFVPGDGDGIVNCEIELTGYVDSSGNGEIYLNYL